MAHITFYGLQPSKASIVFGAWDPIFAETEKKLVTLNKKCQGNQSLYGEFLPIVLYPSPASLLNPNSHPVFESFESKVERLTTVGITNFCKLRLSKKDCEKGIDWIVGFLSQYIDISTIFLSKNQSLGSSGNGDRRTIEKFCLANNINLENSRIVHNKKRRIIYDLHNRRQFVELQRQLGRPLCFKWYNNKPNIPLPTGSYLVKVADDIDDFSLKNCKKVILNISDNKISQLSEKMKNGIWLTPIKRIRQQSW